MQHMYTLVCIYRCNDISSERFRLPYSLDTNAHGVATDLG